MSGTHALLAPSKAEQWITCPGSLQLSRDIADTTSEYAAEGTVYHDIAAQCLSVVGGDLLNAADFVGRVMEADGYPFTIGAENAEFVQQYIDAMRRRPGIHFTEVRLNLTYIFGRADQRGTSDHVAIDVPAKTLYVDDLKFGRGEVVYAHKNKQGMTYACGVVNEYEMKHQIGPGWTIVIGIHQPRINHFDEYRCSYEELMEFQALAQKQGVLAYDIWKANDTDKALKNLKASEKGCRWCKIAGSCAERGKGMLAAFPIIPPQQIAAKRGLLTNDELIDAWLKLDDLEKWITAVRTEATARALAGTEFKGAKLVEGRKGPRQFPDTLMAEALLYAAIGEKTYKPRTIITPTDAEKLLKKNHTETWTTLVEKYIRQSDGAMSLVKVDDDRPPVKIETPEFPTYSPAAAGLV
jgi:hypothetical protein